VRVVGHEPPLVITISSWLIHESHFRSLRSVGSVFSGSSEPGLRPGWIGTWPQRLDGDADLMTIFSKKDSPSPNATDAPGTKNGDPDPPASGRPGSRAHPGLIVAGSLVTGLVTALLLVFNPFGPVEESVVTCAGPLGLAVGWAMLAIFSSRVTDQPRRWAVAPSVDRASATPAEHESSPS
jgi:hypothetical protein